MTAADEARLLDAQREGLPYAAAIAIDRSAGAMLLPNGPEDIPEKLVRQLHDETILQDTPMYWTRSVASNGADDFYGTVMQTDSLRNYAADAVEGLPFCNCHQTNVLPFGRTFDGKFHQARGQNLARTEMDFYVPLDMNVNGVDTSHFVKAVRAGVARDVSIQFNPAKIECSIDGRAMPKSLLDLLFADPEDPDGPCRHIPGMTYKVDGKKIRARGFVKGAHCLHLSPVWRAATPGASIISPSRQLTISENDAPAQWTLLTPAVRTAALLAEAEQLDRVTAVALEQHVRGISFPDVTTLRFAGWSVARDYGDEDEEVEESEEMPADERARKKGDPTKPPSDSNPDPDNDGDDDRTPEGDTDNSHWNKDGTKKKGKWGNRDVDTEQQQESARMPDPTEDTRRSQEPGASGPTDRGQSAANANPAADPAAAGGGPEEAPPPPVTRVASTDPAEADADAEPTRPAVPIWHAEVRRAIVGAGLAPEDFDGDPLAQLQTIGRQLSIERQWGAWGRRYRTELIKEVESEGVRCFGAQDWPGARAAYLPTIERGSADELVSLRDHLNKEASKRLRGGRLSRDDAADGTHSAQQDGKRPRVPAAAYRS